MVKYSEERAGSALSALGDPTRRAILDRISRGPRTLSDIARPLDISLPGALKHVRLLESAGLVVCNKRGRQRWCALDPDGVTSARAWLDQRAAVWRQRLDALEEVVQEQDE